MKHVSLFLALAAVVLLTGPVRAQSVLHTFYGDSSEDRFGQAVSGIGDVNGDGLGDVIVGAMRDDPNGVSNAGRATVFSGVDGSILYTLSGDSQDDHFGVSVSGAGDVNGDGIADVIVGAWLDANNGVISGSARVCSGSNGEELYAFYGPSSYGAFGGSVSGAGDVNGDGFNDVVVGAIGGQGSAQVFSGVDGSIIHTFTGASAGASFGQSVSGAGDTNADGFDDLIVGSSNDSTSAPAAGSAYVYSGASGSLLHTFLGASFSDSLGWSVSGAGDIDADGFDDVIVGIQGDDKNGVNSGSARAYSGKDSSSLFAFYGDTDTDHFGSVVRGVGDTNGDGRPDLMVVATNYPSNTGTVTVFSGSDGSVLHKFTGASAGHSFGIGASGAGDVNGDGFNDVIVGALTDEYGTNSGSAQVFSGCDTCDCNDNGINDADEIANGSSTDCNGNGMLDECEGCPCNPNGIYSYGTGCSGTAGITPQLTLTGCASPSRDVTMEINQALPQSIAILLYGFLETSIPTAGPCTLNASPLLPLATLLPLGGDLATPGSGFISITAQIPAASASGTIKLQAFIADPANGWGYSNTNGVSMAFP